MNATRLIPRRVEKVWGRRDLPAAFGSVAADGEPVGEIWFEDPRGGRPALLVKYLFTSEKLSVQVHPDDALARAHGLPSGKDEAWFVLAAEPDAVIGLGLTHIVDKAVLRRAALDGTIEALVDWRPVKAGEAFYSAAGTVHAIGPGLQLVEVQQNADVTYRLYDYGRPRELHLEEAVAAADPAPWRAPDPADDPAAGVGTVAKGDKFTLERWRGQRSAALIASPSRPVWLIPLHGGGSLDGAAVEAGEVWLLEGDAALMLDPQSDALVAHLPGATAAT